MGDGVEVAAIDPVASMQAIENEQLGSKARDVADRLRRAIDRLGKGQGPCNSDLEDVRSE